MSNDEVTLFTIRGFIESLPDNDKALVKECIAKIRATLVDYRPEYGTLAVTLIGAEMQLQGLTKS